MGRLLAEHMQSVSHEYDEDEERFTPFEDAGPESDSDSGLEELLGAPLKSVPGAFTYGAYARLFQGHGHWTRCLS